MEQINRSLSSRRSFLLLSYPAVFVPLASIALTFLLAPLGYRFWTGHPPASWLGIWNWWDTQYYIEIAKHGYPTSGPKTHLICFLPLYPILIRLVSVFVRDFLLSGLIVSNAAYLAACYFLYRLARLDYDRAFATRAVVLLSLFPSAYFLHAAYTESLFLFFSIASFYYARRSCWWLSGGFGALSGLCRFAGMMLFPALIIEFYLQSKREGRVLWRKELFALGVVALGPLAFLGLNWVLFGSPFHFQVLQRTVFFKQVAFPWHGLGGALNIALHGAPSQRIFVGAYEAAAGLSLVFFVGYSFFRDRFSYGVYTLGSSLLIWVQSFWLSNPRYVLGIFPIFFSLAAVSRNRFLYALFCLVGLVIYAIGLSRFVTDQWAL